MPYDFLSNIQPREYQKQIFETCKNKNCLVVIPTGLGKTLIALMLTIQRMKKFPSEKILFLAPTKPLAEQHLVYFKKYLPELFGEMNLFTGAINAQNRKKIWQNSDIIFSTPQCIANDIKKGLYNLNDVSLLIQDEAHRCIKNYDYNFIAQKYKFQAQNQRIIGLTASPGSESGKIKQICKNLSIQEVEIRTRKSLDVKEYLQELEFEKKIIQFPSEFEEMKHVLNKLFNQYTEELRKRNMLFGPASKTNLIKLQKSIILSLSRGNKNWNYLLGVSACASAVKIQHALELLETQTLESFHKYLKKLFTEAKNKKSKGVMKLVAKPEFNYVYMQSNELLVKKREHPKLEELSNLVQQEQEKNNNIKLIVFTQFRDTATTISNKLNKIKGIKAKVFVGQAKKSGIGMNQKQQKKIIQDFSQGKINVLTSTSLHPEEFIILKKDDKIMIKKIGEFVESFLKDKKGANSQKINNWQALSSDGKRLLFKPITHVHRHIAKDNIIKTKSSAGFDCFITKDHSIFSFNEKNSFIPQKPEINKFIAQTYKCPNKAQTKKIDILEEILLNSKEKNLFGSIHDLSQAKIRILKTNYKILSILKQNNFSIQKLTKLSKKDYSTVNNCLKRLKKECLILQKRENKNYKNISYITKKGREYLEFLEWFFENVKYHKGKYKFKINSQNKLKFNKFSKQNFNINYGKISFPRNLIINKYLARFLGFYVSEGHVRKTKSTSGIFLAARVKKMQELMDESIKRGLKLKTRKNSKGITIDSQISYHLIKDVFKAGIGAYNKEVPEFIFSSPDEIKWEFLYAYFLGDGYKCDNRIVLTTVSRKLVTGLVLLLRMLNIQKLTLHKQKNIYRLNIFESLPFAKIKNKNEKYSKQSYYSLIPTAMQSKKAYKKFENFFSKNKGNIKSRRLGKWKGDICFDYIKKIEKQNKTKHVYDISVKDTENFIGGTGLFCLHNSIAEEGLDIPEVNAVIFYEPIPSAIRAIQRAGRTARLMKGKLIMLITKGTRDENFYYISRAREKSMHTVIQNIKKDLKQKSLSEFNKK